MDGIIKEKKVGFSSKLFIMKYKSLIALSLFATGLSIYRVYYTHTLDFIFLNWNLFLAFMPMLFALWLQKKQNNSWWMFGILFSLWLLFFPNAPYVLTDLKYLNRYGTKFQIPYWFDVVMLCSFALSSLLIGFYSAEITFSALKKRLSLWLAVCMMIFSYMISGYGVYVGRFERFNSWDIIAAPFSLFENVLDVLLHPFQNSYSIKLSLLFGLLFNLVFFSLHEAIGINRKSETVDG
jgi:uncharacterized membrane protein